MKINLTIEVESKEALADILRRGANYTLYDYKIIDWKVLDGVWDIKEKTNYKEEKIN
ncbi:MAG: hypothetical protein AABY22_13205 [Nanoarchaeota archaeon]